MLHNLIVNFFDKFLTEVAAEAATTLVEWICPWLFGIFFIVAFF